MKRMMGELSAFCPFSWNFNNLLWEINDSPFLCYCSRVISWNLVVVKPGEYSPLH